jgi:hypothetical protein
LGSINAGIIEMGWLVLQRMQHWLVVSTDGRFFRTPSRLFPVETPKEIGKRYYLRRCRAPHVDFALDSQRISTLLIAIRRIVKGLTSSTIH